MAFPFTVASNSSDDDDEIRALLIKYLGNNILCALPPLSDPDGPEPSNGMGSLAYPVVVGINAATSVAGHVPPSGHSTGYMTTSDADQGAVGKDAGREQRQTLPPDSSEGWDNLALIVQARMHHRHLLSSQCFMRWRQRTEDRRTQRRRSELLAERYYGLRLCYVMFRAWHWRFQHRLRLSDAMRYASSFDQRRVLLKTFLAWRQRYSRRMAIAEGLASIRRTAHGAFAARLMARWHLFSIRRAQARALSIINARRLASFYLACRWIPAFYQRRMRILVTIAAGFKLGHDYLPVVLPPRLVPKRHAHRHPPAPAHAVWCPPLLYLCFHQWLIHARACVLRRHSMAQSKARELMLKNAIKHVQLRFEVWHSFTRKVLAVRLADTLCAAAAQAHCRLRFAEWRFIARRASLSRQYAAILMKRHALKQWREMYKESRRGRIREELALGHFESYAHRRYLRNPFIVWRHLATHRAFVRLETKHALELRQRLLAQHGLQLIERTATSIAEGSLSPPPTGDLIGSNYACRSPRTAISQGFFMPDNVPGSTESSAWNASHMPITRRAPVPLPAAPLLGPQEYPRQSASAPRSELRRPLPWRPLPICHDNSKKKHVEESAISAQPSIQADSANLSLAKTIETFDRICSPKGASQEKELTTPAPYNSAEIGHAPTVPAFVQPIRPSALHFSDAKPEEIMIHQRKSQLSASPPSPALLEEFIQQRHLYVERRIAEYAIMKRQEPSWAAELAAARQHLALGEALGLTTAGACLYSQSPLDALRERILFLEQRQLQLQQTREEIKCIRESIGAALAA